MLEFNFTAHCKYTISPHKWTYRLSLGLIESWSSLEQIVEFALQRHAYGNTDSGFGLEYPTRPDRADQVRFWRWTRRDNGRVKERKFHFPEVDYLGTLVALLRIQEKHSEASAVAATARTQLPSIELLNVPDRYDLGNYHFKKNFSHDAQTCLRLVLDQRDFALATARAAAKEGFCIVDGSQLVYLGDGKLRIDLQRGNSITVSEELYSHLVERAPKEFERWALRQQSDASTAI